MCACVAEQTNVILVLVREVFRCTGDRTESTFRRHKGTVVIALDCLQVVCNILWLVSLETCMCADFFFFFCYPIIKVIVLKEY